MAPARLELRRGALDAQALAAYERARAFDTSGGLASVAEVLDGAELFDVLAGGVVVLRYALRVNHRTHGAEAVIVAAAGGLRGHDLTAEFLPVIEQQCAGAHALTVLTRRKGLAVKLVRAAFAIDGVILRKRLDVHVPH